jgi:hypothetical protein
MLPLPFHHALQHHGCSVPFVHHHPHCMLVYFWLLEQKKSHCASGLAERSNEQYIYIFIELPLFVDYILNPSKSTFVICSNQLFFLATPPIVWL